MHEQLVHRWRLLVWALVAIPLGVLSLVLFVFTLADAALIAVWVGIPMFDQNIRMTRWLADLHRTYAGGLRGVLVERPYLHAPAGSLLVRTRAVLADPATRRDTWWLFVNGSLGLFLDVVGLAEGILGLLFWWLPPGTALKQHARLDVALLRPAEKSRLALRVQQLTESRAETVDTREVELRRIERDLHDGAQARLVALGMSLALAEEQLACDPDGARALLSEAREASSIALAELRDLVRGICPPVLSDRGLVGAVQALALAAPMGVDVQADVPDRLPAPVESAAYFAVAEGLANVIKHSGASRVWITLAHRDEALTLRVRDDGRGGADPANGTGLRGIERRLSAFDGALVLESPPGGPTELAMVLPCASSSPKISPSSGTV